MAFIGGLVGLGMAVQANHRRLIHGGYGLKQSHPQEAQEPPSGFPVILVVACVLIAFGTAIAIIAINSPLNK